jgi:hypothetical protein
MPIDEYRRWMALGLVEKEEKDHQDMIERVKARAHKQARQGGAG